jgi:DNA polymerase
VDPRERLRRYLEQRRELGESELVLDGMTVEEVMKMLGAARLADRSAPSSGTPRDESRRGGAPGSQDRAAPSSPRQAPFAEPPGPSSRARPGTGAPDVPDAPAETPGRTGREDRPRSDAEAGGDWRSLLRAAGGGPAGEEADMATRKPKRARDAEIAAPKPGERERLAGATPSPAPGAATPEAADHAQPPTPHAAHAGGTELEGAALPGIDAPPGLVIGSAGRELFGDPIAQLPTLASLADVVARCTRCPLYATAKNPVPGEGNPSAGLVCVGEAPGANEDESGRPFIGQAGQLLTKILAAINLAREDVFICNVLKHRPPGNRNPRPEEVEACSPYLVRQLELIRPKVIVAFGTFSAQTLLNTKLGIGQLRGKVHRYYGTPLVVTYHPAALLRNPAWKRPTWEDVQLARRILDRASGA